MMPPEILTVDYQRGAKYVVAKKRDGGMGTVLKLFPVAGGSPIVAMKTIRYLPKYSPDLNPIEMSFSKLKADLRKAAERTIPRLRRRIGRFARTLTARETSNYFSHAGYA